MKKILALLFVCAGLTAMAAPHVNKANLPQATKGQMVMKANTLSNHLTAGVSQEFMAGAKKNVQRVSTENLVNQRAPRRLSDDEIMSNPYVCFLYKAGYDSDGNHVEADPFYAGGGAYWYPDHSVGTYFAGFYWNAFGSTYYLPLTIDYDAGTVALFPDYPAVLVDDDTLKGSGRTRTDTVMYGALYAEDYYLNGNEEARMTGTLYADGSIIFDNNYVYAGYNVIQEVQNNSIVSSDTTYFEEVYLGTEILAANGLLEYNEEQDGTAGTSNVYMFQSNDTLFVGNLWDYGMPSVQMILTADGKMGYDCAYFDPTDSITYLSNPIWDVNDSWISGGLGMFYPISSYTLDDEGYIIDYTWGFDGLATPEAITWDYTMPSNGEHFLYGYQNNKLTWINGNVFVLPTAAVLRGDVNNSGAVNIEDVTVLIDHLLTGDLDDSDTFSSDASDCDLSGDIGIADVTALIDYLLSGAWPE